MYEEKTLDAPLQKYHLVSVPSSSFRGRKKQPGNLIYDPSEARLGVFLCYCGHCNSKLVADKKTLKMISTNYSKSRKRFAVRMILSLAKRIEQ